MSISRVIGEPMFEDLRGLEIEDGDEGGRVMPRPEGVVDHEPLDLVPLLATDEELPPGLLIAPAHVVPDGIDDRGFRQQVGDPSFRGWPERPGVTGAGEQCVLAGMAPRARLRTDVRIARI